MGGAPEHQLVTAHCTRLQKFATCRYCSEHQQTRMGSQESAPKQTIEDPLTGLFNRVQRCRLGGQAGGDGSSHV